MSIPRKWIRSYKLKLKLIEYHSLYSRSCGTAIGKLNVQEGPYKDRICV